MQEAILGVSGGIRDVGSIRGVFGTGRDSRYSGARRGIGALGAPRECRGVRGHLGGIRGSRGVGVSGCIRGGKWTGSPTTLGPTPGPQHSHWFPWGSDLPGQGQASDRNELCRLLYTFGTIFHDSFYICICATSSHILTCNIKKCYRDYFLCRPIYAYPYMINLTYYDTMLLIMNDYFSHQISESVHLPWVYVHSSICDTDLV